MLSILVFPMKDILNRISAFHSTDIRRNINLDSYVATTRRTQLDRIEIQFSKVRDGTNLHGGIRASFVA